MGDSLTTSDYNYENQEEITPQSAVIYERYLMRTGFRFMYVAVYSITIFLGILLNTIVIFMAKKDKFQSGKTLILSLAVTHLVFCLFLPFNLISAWQEFTWKFGDEACKLVSYVRIVNMFSVSMMITFWKMDWCCWKSYEKHMVLLSWVIGVILSIPSLLYREVQDTADGKVCLDKYDTTEGLLRMTAVMCCRLIFGLLLPLVVTCFNCFKKNNKKSVVVTLVISVHFLCWAPVLCLSVLQVKLSTYNSLITQVLPLATALSVLNSCISPIIFFWKGM